jgi:adenylate cyclase
LCWILASAEFQATNLQREFLWIVASKTLAGNAHLEEAVALAERGVQLNPPNQRARSVLAFVRFLSSEIAMALAETERALALNPHSLSFMDNIGYLFNLLGEWERSPALIRKTIKLNLH